jgi:hypothetical protein
MEPLVILAVHLFDVVLTKVSVEVLIAEGIVRAFEYSISGPFQFVLDIGCVGLLLTAYQRTAFDVEAGSIRALRITELLAAFACLVAAPDSGQQALFYAAGGMWCLAGLHTPALPEVTDCEYT